jgi:hypothetical protein
VLTSSLVDNVEGDLVALGDLAGPDVAAVVTRLVGPLRPMVRARLLEVLNDLVQEHNREEEPALVLSLLGDQVRLASPPSDVPSLDPLATGDLTARIALRISEQMKQEIEVAARSAGVSANTWIVRALDRGLHAGPGNPKPKKAKPRRGAVASREDVPTCP